MGVAGTNIAAVDWPDPYLGQFGGYADEAISAGDSVIGLMAGNWDTNIDKLPNIFSDNSRISGIHFSRDGKYLAITGYKAAGTVCLRIFKIGANDSFAPFKTLDFAISGSAGALSSVRFSPDSRYLAWIGSNNNTQGLRVWEIVNDDFIDIASTVTNPPTWNSNGAYWSPDSKLLAIGNLASNAGGVVFSVAQGVFSRLNPSPNMAQALATYEADFSPDGKYLAVGLSGTSAYGDVPWAIYEFANNVYLSQLPTSVLSRRSYTTRCIKFAPNNKYLVLGNSNSPYINIYSIDNSGGSNVYTAQPNPAVLPTSEPMVIEFTSDGQFLFVFHASSPYVTAYKITNNIFGKINLPVITTALGAGDASFSPSNKYLAVSRHNASSSPTTEQINIYKTRLSNVLLKANFNAIGALTGSQGFYGLGRALTTTPAGQIGQMGVLFR